MTDSELQEKLKNDFRSFRIEHDNRISQNYIEKEVGKGLSTEDFTTAEKEKLASLTIGGGGGASIDTSRFVLKEDGKGLSTEDFTSIEKEKLASLSLTTTITADNVYISEIMLDDIMGTFVG